MTPLSKRATETQSLVATLPKEPVINVSDSPKNKKRSAEDPEPSSPKKQKVTRKSSAVVSKLVDPDNFDDFVDNMDLDTSDDISSQKLYFFLPLGNPLLEAPKPDKLGFPFAALLIVVFPVLQPVVKNLTSTARQYLKVQLQKSNLEGSVSKPPFYFEMFNLLTYFPVQPPPLSPRRIGLERRQISRKGSGRLRR